MLFSPSSREPLCLRAVRGRRGPGVEGLSDALDNRTVQRLELYREDYTIDGLIEAAYRKDLVMAYLNAQERADLLDKLRKMKFGRAKGKLRRMDPKGRMAYYRNAQAPGRIVTCFNLEGLGTRVYLVETMRRAPLGDETTKFKAKFDFIEVIVEPTPENRT